jgi:hypothetical protein
MVSARLRTIVVELAIRTRFIPSCIAHYKGKRGGVEREGEGEVEGERGGESEYMSPTPPSEGSGASLRHSPLAGG